MGTPTIGATSAVQLASGVGSDQMAFTMVAGRAYVIKIGKTGTGTRSYTAADDLAGSTNVWGNYVETATTNSTRAASITCICTTGGTANITVTSTGGTSTWRWQIIEIIPTSGSLSFGGSSTFEDGATGTSHQMAASSGFSPPADSAIVGVGVPDAGTGTVTAGTNYVKQSGTSGNFASQTRTTATLLTNETAPYTTANSVKEKNVAIYVTESAGGGGGAAAPFIGNEFSAAALMGA